MPKAKTDSATVKRFERALRKALNTPPEAPRAKPKKAKRKKRS